MTFWKNTSTFRDAPTSRRDLNGRWIVVTRTVETQIIFKVGRGAGQRKIEMMFLVDPHCYCWSVVHPGGLSLGFESIVLVGGWFLTVWLCSSKPAVLQPGIQLP